MYAGKTRLRLTALCMAGPQTWRARRVPLTDLLSAVHASRRRYHLTCQSAVCGGRGTPPLGVRGTREFHLHPCFANSLRLAQVGQGGGLGGLMGGLDRAYGWSAGTGCSLDAASLGLHGVARGQAPFTADV